MSTTTIDAADLTVIHELKLSTLDMGWLAKALLTAAAHDEAFGVTYHAHIVADGLSATATATDGYRIHQLQMALRAPVGPLDVVIPRDALVWASKNVRTFVAKKDALIEPIAILMIAVPAIQYTTAASGKPGPVLLDFWESSVLRGTAVIQPSRTEADE